MKKLAAVFLATLGATLAQGAGASFSYDSATGILTDSTAGRMWVLHGIGFGSSYLFPGFANTWVSQLNQSMHGGYDNWRLPTVTAPLDDTAPADGSGDLGQLFMDLSAAYADRSLWPFGLGSDSYGGNIIYTDTGVPNTFNFWGLSFGSGKYAQVYPGNAYAYVGVLAVRPVPEPESWALLMAGLALVAWKQRRSSHSETGENT